MSISTEYPCIPWTDKIDEIHESILILRTCEDCPPAFWRLLVEPLHDERVGREHGRAAVFPELLLQQLRLLLNPPALLLVRKAVLAPQRLPHRQLPPWPLLLPLVPSPRDTPHDARLHLLLLSHSELSLRRIQTSICIYSTKILLLRSRVRVKGQGIIGESKLLLQKTNASIWQDQTYIRETHTAQSFTIYIRTCNC